MTKPRKAATSPRRPRTAGENGKNGHAPPTTPNSRTGPNVGGRPLHVINWVEFDALCAVQSTLEEIAGFFACDERTIERAVQREKSMGFADYHAQKSRHGKTSLRRKQFQVALGGDKTMLIWLGKQYLAQRDSAQLEHVGPAGGPIQTVEVTGTDDERAERTVALLRRAEMRKAGVV